MPERNIEETLRRILGESVYFSPSEPYAAACRIWNAAINRRPLAVVPCRDRTEVAAAIKAGRTCGLTIAIRGAGTTLPAPLSPMAR